MRRRTVLATTSALLAGCTGATDPGDGSTATTTGRTTSATSTETTVTTTAQPYDLLPPDSASMTADEVRERLGERDCTALSDLPTTCPGDDGRLDVSASPTVADLAGGTVEFTVENPTDEEFQTNHYGWVLRKWDGERWRRLAPLAIPGSLDSIPPDESHTHRIESAESRVVRSQHDLMMDSDVTLGGLGPGVYGFSTEGWFESTGDTELAQATVFGFAGEARAVRPTDAVSRVGRDGSELVVSAIEPNRDSTEVAVSLVDGDPDARLLPEHVHQLAALRNTLPYTATDGVETIRYSGIEDDARMADTYLAAATPDGTTRYGFRDLTFEVSVEEA